MGHASSRDGEFAEIMTNHFGLNVDFNEMLPVVYGDSSANKLWENGHVSSVGADGFGLRTKNSVEEVLVLDGDAASETAADTGWQQADDVVVFVIFRPHGHGVEFVHGEATVSELFLDARRGRRKALSCLSSAGFWGHK